MTVHEKIRQSIIVVMAVSTLIGLGSILAACANDAKVTNRVKGTAEKINMPDGFATVSDTCDPHGFRVYENSDGGLYVVRDPKCGRRP